MNGYNQIRELYQEYKDGTRVELPSIDRENIRTRLLKYINEELRRISGLRISLEAHNPQLKDSSWQVEEYSHLVRVKKIIERVPDPEDSPRTFKTKFSKDQLKTIRQELIKRKLIDQITEADFLYLFTAQPGTRAMMQLYWKGSRPLCHTFLGMVVFQNEKYNFPLVNKCMNFKNGKKLDSNSKSKAQYSHSKLLSWIAEI